MCEVEILLLKNSAIRMGDSIFLFKNTYLSICLGNPDDNSLLKLGNMFDLLNYVSFFFSWDILQTDNTSKHAVYFQNSPSSPQDT